MAYAATHVILTMVLVDLFRDYLSKWKFSLWYVVIGGIAGLAPDIDIIISWILTGNLFTYHHGITHTLLIPVLLLVAGAVSWKFWRKGAGLFFLVCSFGWGFHLVLDIVFWGLANPLWPFLAGGLMVFPDVDPGWASALDAFVLLAWLLHEQWARKIKDYI